MKQPMGLPPLLRHASFECEVNDRKAAEFVTLLPPAQPADHHRLHQRRQTHRRHWRRLAIVIVAVALLLCLISVAPLKPLLARVFEWIHLHPIAGSMVYLVAFCLAIPCCIPSTLFEAVGGSLFGVYCGVPLVLLGKTGGSVVAFAMGRYLGRASLGGYLERRFPSFRAISQVLGDSPAIWKPLLLIQLSSIPNLLKCFALSLTEVSMAAFAMTCLVGSIPHAVIWAYVGSNARDFMALLSSESSDTSMSKARNLMLFGGLAFTFVAMALLSIYIRKELNRLQTLALGVPINASSTSVLLAKDPDANVFGSDASATSTCGSSSDENEIELELCALPDLMLHRSESDLSHRHSISIV